MGSIVIRIETINRLLKVAKLYEKIANECLEECTKEVEEYKKLHPEHLRKIWIGLYERQDEIWLMEKAPRLIQLTDDLGDALYTGESIETICNVAEELLMELKK